MTAPTHIGTYAVGEKPEDLVVTFTDADGAALVITGYNARALWRPASSPASAATTDTATVSNGAAGVVTYTWDADNTAVPGLHVLEIWVGNSTRRYASRLFTYRVRAGVATAAPSI